MNWLGRLVAERILEEDTILDIGAGIMQATGVIGRCHLAVDCFERYLHETKAFFAEHDPRKACKVECLYERRNKRILALISMDPEEVAEMRRYDEGAIHKNFV